MPLDNTKETAFNDIDYSNKTKPVSLPVNINDIDVDETIYDTFGTLATTNRLDLSSINSLTNVSQSRDTLYDMIDVMAADPIISKALDIYTADACETNANGQVVWAQSDDNKVLGMVTHILDQINVDKNAYNWVYSLVKYGDLYLRMLKDSEYNYQIKDTTDKLNEDIILKAYNKNDHYAMYLEETKNPAEVFDLQKYGKSICYIRAHIQAKPNNPDDLLYQNALLYQYNFRRGDLDIFPATSYVHASLENTSSRTEEQVVISRDGDDSTMSYGVKRGQSVLYSAFKIWRELSLLENSVLLNRITKSAVIRVISIEGGDMEDREKRNTVQRFKQMIEQKSSMNLDNSITNYTNPGPMENTLYTITHDGKGAITTSQIGGDVTPDQLTDLDYFRTKLFGALGIPKQYLGCLRGDTPILLLSGKTVTLEEMFNNLREYLGKGIMACNEDGSLQPTVITNIAMTKPSASFLRIHLDNGKYVDVTDDHKMMLRDGSFVYAKDLNVGDSLMPYYDRIEDGRRWVLDNKEGKYKKQYRVVAESVCDMPAGYQVHHKDEVKINDDFDNLIPLSLREHYEQHKDMLHKKAQKKIAENWAAGLYTYKDITNGIEYRKINTLTTELPDGWWFEGCPKPVGFGEKLSAIFSGVPKNYDCAANFGTGYLEKSKITKTHRQAESCYDEQYKAQSERCKEHALNKTGWFSAEAMKKKIGRYPENRRSKERYVRCLCCGSVNKIRCNDDWYNEYLNEDLFWFCSKDCASIGGRGKLARSYKLFKDSGCNIDKYGELRVNEKFGRRDTYFLPTTLLERLEYIDNYVPECNHKVVDIEFIDVDEPAYDISVEADCHTFALPCGIFVHNCTDDATGFNGGTSLSIISSQYAKTIKRVQNSFIQAITDAVNLILLDRGLTSYINKFTIHMQPPTTQEEKDRRESISSEVSNIQNIMSLIGDAGVEDPATKLKILTNLLSSCISNPGVITALQEQIDIFEEEGSEEDTGDEVASEDMDMGGDFDLGGDLGVDFGGDLGGEDLGGEEPLPTPEEAGVPTEAEAPEENFYNGIGELLNEEDEYNLPSFEELGINFNDVR